MQDLALGGADAPQLHHVPLQREDPVEGGGGRVLEHLHLDELHLVLDRVEVREVVLEHPVEDLVEEEVGPLRDRDLQVLAAQLPGER